MNIRKNSQEAVGILLWAIFISCLCLSIVMIATDQDSSWYLVSCLITGISACALSRKGEAIINLVLIILFIHFLGMAIYHVSTIGDPGEFIVFTAVTGTALGFVNQI